MNIGANSKEQLLSIVERVENLETQIGELRSDRSDIFAEAKGNGFDVAALKAIIKLRKEDANKRAERESILETYMTALGMLADLPLGQAAMNRAVG